MDEWPLCGQCGGTACPPVIQGGKIVCPDCAGSPIVVETVCSRRIRPNTWPKATPAVAQAQEQPGRTTAPLPVRTSITPASDPKEAIRTTSPLPVRTSFAPGAQCPETIPAWATPHKELPMCGCTRLMAGCPESLDMAAYDALCRAVRALVATGNTRVGLERLRAMVSPKLDKPMAYWPWRDLVEASGFTITKGRGGHPAEVVLR